MTYLQRQFVQIIVKLAEVRDWIDVYGDQVKISENAIEFFQSEGIPIESIEEMVDKFPFGFIEERDKKYFVCNIHEFAEELANAIISAGAKEAARGLYGS